MAFNWFKNKKKGDEPPSPESESAAVKPPPDAPDTRRMTFTGVQVIDAGILAYLPDEGFASSIDAYQAMIDDGRRIQAYIPEGVQWSDLGTPERYQAKAREVMAESAWGVAHGLGPRLPLNGRLWPGTAPTGGGTG